MPAEGGTYEDTTSMAIVKVIATLRMAPFQKKRNVFIGCI